jgi:hypothetical protein
MKTLLKFMSLIQVLMLLSSLPVFADNNKNVPADSSSWSVTDNTICLEVKVHSTEKNVPLTGVTIKVYLDNEPILLTNTDMMDVKKISMERNRYYSIEISKEGYYSKLVRISTMMPKDQKVYNDGFVYEYDLQIELIRVDPESHSFYLDFPIALISYDKKSDRFNYSQHYSEGINNHIKTDTIK